MKRFGALENSDLSTCLSNENKTIVNHLLEKLGQVEEDDSTGKIFFLFATFFFYKAQVRYHQPSCRL